MNAWKPTTLGKVLADKGYIRGPFGSALKRNEMKKTGIPVYEQKNAIYGDRDFRFFIDDKKFEELKRFQVNTNDLIISCSGTVGKISIINENDPKGIISQALLILRPDIHKVTLEYLYYLLSSSHGFELLTQASHGSVQVNIAERKVVEQIPLFLPPLQEQKSIASILSSLDDKIDLLHRQNKTLESMAETLYRQWFVEEAQDDWPEVALSDVTARITDGAHASPPTVEAGKPMASVKDMYDWGINLDSCRKISEDDYQELVKSDCRPLKDDILIAKDGSYLKHVFVAEKDMNVVVLSSIAILRPNGKYHPLLLATFLKLKSTIEAMENIVTGAVIPRIVLKDFRKFNLLLPPVVIQEKALNTIKPIYEKCWENNRQIQTIEKLRDKLLPKLMNGEVRAA